MIKKSKNIAIALPYAVSIRDFIHSGTLAELIKDEECNLVVYTINPDLPEFTAIRSLGVEIRALQVQNDCNLEKMIKSIYPLNGFVHWYNFDHRHSGIRYVSPAQRHAGDDHEILAARHALYLQARELNPARWSGNTRNWTPVGAVTLNPERDAILKTHLASNNIQPLAA